MKEPKLPEIANAIAVPMEEVVDLEVLAAAYEKIRLAACGRRAGPVFVLLPNGGHVKLIRLAERH